MNGSLFSSTIKFLKKCFHIKRLNISRKVLSKEKQLLDVDERRWEAELIESLNPDACACVVGTE
jgi:hypothetical protein